MECECSICRPGLKYSCKKSPTENNVEEHMSMIAARNLLNMWKRYQFHSIGQPWSCCWARTPSCHCILHTNGWCILKTQLFLETDSDWREQDGATWMVWKPCGFLHQSLQWNAWCHTHRRKVVQHDGANKILLFGRWWRGSLQNSAAQESHSTDYVFGRNRKTEVVPSQENDVGWEDWSLGVCGPCGSKMIIMQQTDWNNWDKTL